MTGASLRSGAPARELRLSRIADRLESAGLLASRASADPAITGITDDSRRVARGDLFCAWAGTVVDAHRFVPAAADAGAAAALVERPVAAASLPQMLVHNGRRAAALAAAELFGDPASELVLVGVTGTNGKTTTVWMLRHLLGLKRTPASIGTLGIYGPQGRIADAVDVLTTPGPVELARTLRALRDAGVDALAMEVSSHALHQGRVDALRFDVAVFTNLTRDHLDYHRTFEEYLAAKLTLAQLLREEGVAVVNADDAAWRELPQRGLRTVSFSASGAPEADVRALNVAFDATGARFDLVTPRGSVPAELPLLGDYNVANALGAVAACMALGDAAEALVTRLRSMPQVPGRLERIAERPCPILRDYAHTPDALARALEALRPLVRGRLIVVFGAGGDRDPGKRAAMGATAARHADVVIVTSDNPRTEDPGAIIDGIVAGMGSAPHERITDRREAIARALAIARETDLVLLAGKGHETYQIIGATKRDFDEKQVVADLLSRGAA
ncbi:MAG: UDP-N-acetylmuramoyl-L-alanyl-D-glutamate--2,6-diaminopimelate ligase [Longimicrobiales bacterium]